jgi:hypothetical protein
MTAPHLSIAFSQKTIEIPREGLDILPSPNMRASPKVIKYLNEIWVLAGKPLPKEIVTKAAKRKAKIKITTVRDILSGKTGNPGVETLEAFALGIGHPAIDIIAQYLKHPPEELPSFKKSELAEVWQLVEELPDDKQTEAIGYINFIKNAVRGLK